MKNYSRIFAGADNIYSTNKYIVKQTFTTRCDKKGNVKYDYTDIYIPKTRSALDVARGYGYSSYNERCRFNGRRKRRFLK